MFDRSRQKKLTVFPTVARLVVVITPLVLATPSYGEAFRAKKGSTYLKLGTSWAIVPHAWNSKGSELDFSENAFGLGFYGQRAFTEWLTVIASGSLMSYAVAHYEVGVPVERTSRSLFAGPWSVLAGLHAFEWGQNALGAELGVSWMFAAMPGLSGTNGSAKLEYGRRFEKIRSELWSKAGAQFSFRGETRPQGRAEIGMKYHDKKWRWEVKGKLEGAVALERSGPTADQIIRIEETPITSDSSNVVVHIEGGRPLGDNFAATLAGTWYVLPGVGIDLSYQHTFVGTDVSAARRIGLGVSYAW